MRKKEKTNLCDGGTGNNDSALNQIGEKEEENKPLITELPTHLIVEIFCKIPLKKLIQCQCVCKSWKSLLSDPQFTRDLFSRSPSCLVVRGNIELTNFLVDPNNISTSRPNDVVLKLSKDPIFRTDGIHAVNSCNGFLCLSDPTDPVLVLHISNPITGESLALPPPPPPKYAAREFTYFCGLGFCPKTNVYKVVVVESPSQKSKKSETFVITVGSAIWRSLGDSVCPCELGVFRFGVYLDGFLHWLAKGSEGSPSIIAFDVENECFHLLPVPPCLKDFRRPTPRLGALKGCLSICIYSDDFTDVWVMKDYGVQESWTQDIGIGINPLRIKLLASVHHVTEEGKVLLLNKNRLVTYTPSTSDLEIIQVHGIRSVNIVDVHKTSFISLKSVIGG